MPFIELLPKCFYAMHLEKLFSLILFNQVTVFLKSNIYSKI